MSGSWRPSQAFIRRRKKRASSRRWAIMSKRLQENPKPVITEPENVDPITQARPAQQEDTTVGNVNKCGSSLGVGVLILSFRSMYQFWRNILSQSFGFMRKWLFWRGYGKQIETLQNQLAELQREMDAVRSALEANKNLCLCQRTLVVGSICPRIPPPPVISSVDPLIDLTPPASALPSPPPPPPLPPPPPPCATSLQPYIPKKRVASSHKQEKQDVLVAVTLMDLQTVKLRKVNRVTSKRSPEKMRTPLVTVADLQNVRLRRPHCKVPAKSFKRLNVGRTPVKSPISLRTQLKRVQINRSPGGTPLFDKENMETGTGFTPIMTQALRHKFQIALPRGPSPKAVKLNGSFDDPN
ncbi:hypothetical protein DPEC_G00224100 [Dallia pectoralis]|uniref:Uncharacterized protein n=1 Tax=Dallia pectoralis TaxID=75939 RepID=A0ACC2G0E2_DALPE|nr:hypothetical protein DPEC_G00224100 [Dallia pectoralis]